MDTPIMTDSQLLIEDALDAVETYIFADKQEVIKQNLKNKMLKAIQQSRRDIHGSEL